MCDKKIRCVSCGKPIAEEASIQAGYVKITCRCGTVNEIKAEQKTPGPQYQIKGTGGRGNSNISIHDRV